MRAVLLALLAVLSALPLTVAAQAPDSTPRPEMRGATAVTDVAEGVRNAAPGARQGARGMSRPEMRASGSASTRAGADVSGDVGTDSSTDVEMQMAAAVPTPGVGVARSVLRLRPQPRPARLVPGAPRAAATPGQPWLTSDDLAANTDGVDRSWLVAGRALSPRPSTRPRGIVERAMAKKRERQRGAVCGDPDIQGEVIGYVPGKIRGCGVQDAVRVRSVQGIRLSQRSVMDCGTARALRTWVAQGLKPAVASYGGGVRELKVAAHYACRTRNNQRGAKISEHGRGRAIDISAIRLRDGSEITVLRGWGKRVEGRILRQMAKAACGPFGTVLGPDADRFHRDHFHFDTARYRSGRYCR